jgi:ribose transport system permease protein
MPKSISISKMLNNERNTENYFQRYGALLVLVTILIVNVLVTPNFISINTAWNLIVQSCPIILTGMGMTMAIVTGGIDISVGSLMAIGAMVVSKMLPFGIFPAICSALIICAVFGTFTGFAIAKFKIQPMIMTLIMMMIGRGFAQVLNDAKTLRLDNVTFSQLGDAKIGDIIPVQLFIIVGIVAIIFFIISRTVWGRHIQAIGNNSRAAQLAGVDIIRNIIYVYMFCALLAGFAGIVEVARLGTADANGLGKLMELDAIAAVAIGGTSMTGGRARVLGTVFGALVMQLITITVNMNNIPYEAAQITKSVVIVFAVFLQRESKK